MTDQPHQSVLNQAFSAIDKYKLAYNYDTVSRKYCVLLKLGFYFIVVINIVSIAVLVYTLDLGRARNKPFDVTVASTVGVIVLSSILLLYLSYKTYVKYKVNVELSGEFVDIARSVQSYFQSVSAQYESNDVTLVQLMDELNKHIVHNTRLEKVMLPDFIRSARILPGDKRLLNMDEKLNNVSSLYKVKLSEISTILQEIEGHISTLEHKDCFSEGLHVLIHDKLEVLIKQEFCNSSVNSCVELEGKLCRDLICSFVDAVSIVQSYQWPTKRNFITKSMNERAYKLCDSLKRVQGSLECSKFEGIKRSLFDTLCSLIGEIDEFMFTVDMQHNVTMSKAEKKKG